MGVKELEIKLHTNYTDEDIKRVVAKKLRIDDFSYTIFRKSLDARNRKIHWNIAVAISSPQIKQT